MDYLLWTLAALLVAGGIAGTLIPAIPGSLLVFAGLVCGAWADGFTRVGWWTIGVLFFITLLSYAADLLAAGYGARRTGAGRGAMIGAFAGSLAGMFFGLAGIILGPFIGAVIGEYLVRRDLKQAGIAGTGAWLGLLLASAVKGALAVAMIGIFAMVYFSSA